MKNKFITIFLTFVLSLGSLSYSIGEEFNFNINKSVNSPRFHHLFLPDLIYHENNVIDIEKRNLLKSKGYYINNKKSVIGRVDAIHVNPEGFLFGGADNRGDDKSLGF